MMVAMTLQAGVAGSFVWRWLVGPLVFLAALGGFMATAMQGSFGAGVAVSVSSLIFLAISGHLRSDSSNNDDPVSAEDH